MRLKDLTAWIREGNRYNVSDGVWFTFVAVPHRKIAIFKTEDRRLDTVVSALFERSVFIGQWLQRGSSETFGKILNGL